MCYNVFIKIIKYVYNLNLNIYNHITGTSNGA